MSLTRGQSETILEARENASSLRENIDQQLEKDSNLASRLDNLELPPGFIDLDGLEASDAESTFSTKTGIAHPSAHANARRPLSMRGNAGRSGFLHSSQPAFEDVLFTTRVYARVQPREVDAASTILTTRSRAWSILSGISLSQVSVIAVIKLPLQECELRRFWALAGPEQVSDSATASTSGHHDTLRRDIERVFEAHQHLCDMVTWQLQLLHSFPVSGCATSLVDAGDEVGCPLLPRASFSGIYP